MTRSREAAAMKNQYDSYVEAGLKRKCFWALPEDMHKLDMVYIETESAAAVDDADKKRKQEQDK